MPDCRTLAGLTSNQSVTPEPDQSNSCPTSPSVKKTFRLVILGSPRTGKTSIVSRFLDEEFDERYIPTIENFHRKIYRNRGEAYQLDIMDRSGSNPFPASRRLYFYAGDIFLLVGSYDNEKSIKELAEIYKQIEECKLDRPKLPSNQINALFVINKSDIPLAKRELSHEQILDILKDILPTSDDLVSCSAALNENISKVFGKLFTLGKLPKLMNPEIHKTLRNELSEDGVLNRRNQGSIKNVLKRFQKDAEEQITDVYKNVRRSSLRTDLLRAKSCSFLIRGQISTYKANRKSQRMYSFPQKEQTHQQDECSSESLSVKEDKQPPSIRNAHQQQCPVTSNTSYHIPAGPDIFNTILNSAKRCVIS